MNKPIFTNSSGRPFFPGFKSVFGIEWPVEPTATIILSQSDLDTALAITNLKERTYNLVSLYLNAIKKYIEDEESVVDIWYVVVPNAVLTLCRPKSLSGKATYSKKQIETFTSGQISLFPEDNEDLSQYVEMYESDSDFHDQLKARAIYNKIACPIQVMLESTLQFQPKDGSDEYNSDMKAHLAWTHSSSLYYKLGCLPWKLDAVREGVCYVGLVFKKLQDTGKQKGYACSAAQMFLDSGDGVVFRGNIGPWISKNEKNRTAFSDLSAKHLAIGFLLIDISSGVAFGSLNSLLPAIAQLQFDSSSIQYGFLQSSLTIGLLFGNTIYGRLISGSDCVKSYCIVTYLALGAYLAFGYRYASGISFIFLFMPPYNIL